MDVAPSRARSQTWKWRRTSATQSSLLEAAREVFVEEGFTRANVSDIVERAGSSVGSLYHHFGGKSELFIALWNEHRAVQRERAENAVAEAREKGATSPAKLYLIGTEAVLNGSWERRDLTLLFNGGDTPPGFELMRRENSRDWIGRNDALLQLAGDPFDQLFTNTLQAVVGQAAREVAGSADREAAKVTISAMLNYLERLIKGGPWRP